MTFFAGYDGLLCDLDGVIYSGDRLIDGAEIVNDLISRGIKVGFVTNNASKTSEDVASKLQELGINATLEMVHTSAHAAIALLVEKFTDPSATPVLVVGSKSLAAAVAEAGFPVVDSADDQPAVVIQGFSPETGWRNLAEASYAIGPGGAYWLVTNRDLTIPQERGKAPGNGSLIQAVSNAAGKQPDASAGKPAPALFLTAAREAGMTRPLMVGDRLDTDIAGGAAAGFDTALVLTGVHQRTDVDNPEIGVKPTWVLNNLRELLQEPKNHD